MTKTLRPISDRPLSSVEVWERSDRGPTEDRREIVAFKKGAVEQLFSVLREAGLLRGAPADLDDLLPSGVVQGSKKGIKDFRRLFSRLVDDVDRDGRLDVVLEDLLATGVLEPDVTLEKLRATLSPKNSPVDEWQGVPVQGNGGVPDQLAGMKKPNVHWRIQQTADLRSAPLPSSLHLSGGPRAVLDAPMMRLPDGTSVQFVDEVPPGATLTDGPQLTIVKGGSGFDIVLSVPSDDGGRIEVPLRETGVARDDALSPEDVREALDCLFGKLDALGTDADPLLCGFRDNVRRHWELLVQTTPPEDPAERSIWHNAQLEDGQIESRTALLTETYGVRPFRYVGWINDAREVEVARVFGEVAQRFEGISADFLYTVAMGEGLGVKYLDPHTHMDRVDVDRPLDGFSCVGLDTFGSRLDKEGLGRYLPQGYVEGTHFWTKPITNELEEKFDAAGFKDLESALIGLAATLSQERDRVLADVRDVFGKQAADELLGSEAELNYLVYLYFNIGGGSGRSLLHRDGVHGLEKTRRAVQKCRKQFFEDVESLTGKKPEEIPTADRRFWTFAYFHLGSNVAKKHLLEDGLSWDGVHNKRRLHGNENGRLNTLLRVATWDLLRGLGCLAPFDDAPDASQEPSS